MLPTNFGRIIVIAQRDIYSLCSRWGSCQVHWGLHWVHEAILMPTCKYRQRETLALGASHNAKPQRQWEHILVKYRLYAALRIETYDTEQTINRKIKD